MTDEEKKEKMQEALDKYKAKMAELAIKKKAIISTYKEKLRQYKVDKIRKQLMS